MCYWDRILPGNSLSVDSAKKGIWSYKTYSGHEVPVLVANHPEVHYLPPNKKGKDLRKEYVAVFDLAQRICRGEYTEPVYRPILVPLESDADFYLLEQTINSTSYWQATNVKTIFDVEQGMSKKDKDKYTALHKESRMLCFTLTWALPGETNPTVVIVRTRHNSKKFIFNILCWLLKGKTICGSNIAFDILATIAQWPADDESICTSKEMMPIVEAAFYFFSLLNGWHDTWLWHFCLDQGSINNGLKSLVTQYFMKPDYSLHIKDLFTREKQKNPKATYEDIPYSEEKGMWEVEWYVGLDGMWNWFVLQVIEPHIENPNHPNQMAYQFKLEEVFAAIILTYEGFPVDIEYLKTARFEVQQEIAFYQKWVNEHPLVKECGLEGLNVNSPKQMTAVVDKCIQYYPELEHQMMRSDSGTYWSTADGAGMDVLLNCPGWIGEFWKVNANIRSLRHLDANFLSMPEDYAIDRGRFGWRVHPTYMFGKSDFNQGGDSTEMDSGTEGTDSSRWASSPNVQNIPSRIDPVKVSKIRRAYIAHRC